MPREAARSYQTGRGCPRQPSWLIRGKLGQLDATAAYHRRDCLLAISYSQHISGLFRNNANVRNHLGDAKTHRIRIMTAAAGTEALP